MIGLSLSFCIQDILDGKVKLEQVIVIITATKAATDAEWETVLAEYAQVYWRKDARKARRIANMLRDSGRIVQPRLLEQRPFNIAQSHWLVQGKAPR